MKFKLSKIFKSLEDNSELIDEAMEKYKEKHNLEYEELQPLIEDKKSDFYKYLKEYIDKKAKEQKEQEKEDKTTKTTNFLEAIGGGDDPYDTSVLEKVYKKYGSYIDKFNDKKKLPVKAKQDEINNYFDKKKQEKEQSDDTEDNEGNKKSTLDKVKGALETAGGAVISGAKAAGKAIGKGAGAVGSAVSTGVGNLSKKLSHKNRFAEMEAKYDKFVKAHNNFLSERGTDPIQKVFEYNPDQEDVYNKNAWLEEAAPLDLNNKTEIQKYQELANKILNYYKKDGNTESKYRANINGNIDYYQKTTDQAGKAKAIESIEQSLDNLFLQFGKVHKWFLEDGVGDKVENVTESNGNETEEQNEDNPKKGKLSKAKKVAGEVGSAVVEKGKAAGRGAKVLGNALLDKASGLKRTVGKKLKRKKSAQQEATPEASAPEASTNAVTTQELAIRKELTEEDVAKQLVKVVNRYNEFLENYKKFAKKNKHSLKEIVKSVFPDKNDQYHWDKRVVDQHEEFKIDKSELDDKEKIAEKWKKLSNRLVSYVPVSNTFKYIQIFDGINRRVSTTEDFKTLMNEYNLPAKKILRYMEAVLARLNSTASEGIVGRTLKAMTKGDEESQEQKPRNLEEAFIIREETDDEGKKELVYTNNSQVSKAFEKAAKYFKNNKGDEKYGMNENQELVGYFSGIKGFKSAISSALKSTSLGAWSLYRKDANDKKVDTSSTRHSAMGVILISMAYLPGGSESILNACDGLKQGGLKGTGNDFIGYASKVRKEIKKLALEGATGDKLVNKLKISNAKTSLEGLIDINALKQIMSKFGKLAKLKRKAVNEKEKAGKKIDGLKTAYHEDGVKGVLKKINPFSKSKNKKGSKSDE